LPKNREIHVAYYTAPQDKGGLPHAGSVNDGYRQQGRTVGGTQGIQCLHSAKIMHCEIVSAWKGIRFERALRTFDILKFLMLRFRSAVAFDNGLMSVRQMPAME